MRTEIIYCPHLGRDLRPILAKVPNPRIATGYPTPKGHDGCLESHKDIIRRAQADRLPAVFVMEDDCLLTESFDYGQWLATAERAHVEYGIDVLFGGSCGTYDPKRLLQRGGDGTYGLIRMRTAHSAQCTVYFATGYERALRAVQPWDLSLGDQGLAMAVTWPYVGIQQPCFSGILQQDVDYVHHFHRHEQWLGEVFGLGRPPWAEKEGAA